MKKVLLVLLIFVTRAAFGQSKYRIEADYLSGKTTYLKLDKHENVIDTLSKAKFKKNAAIEVRVKNVNPLPISP